MSDQEEKRYYAISCPCGDDENCPGLKVAQMGSYTQLVSSPDIATMEAFCEMHHIDKGQIYEIAVRKVKPVFVNKAV